MRKFKVGELSLGIVLVTIGIVVIIGNFIDSQLAIKIIRWWPIIIILLGIEIIVYSLKRNSYNIKFDGFSIFAIILIILISIGMFIICNIEENFNGFDIFKNVQISSKYHSEYQKSFDILSDKKNISINNSFGNITVIKTSENIIKVDAYIKIDNNEEELAYSISNSIVNIEQGDIIKITTQTNEYLKNRVKIQNIAVDYLIKIPEGFNMEIQNSFGNININNIKGNLSIKNAHGDVNLDFIKGDIYINNTFANIVITNIYGNLNIYNKNGNLIADSIEGDLKAEVPFGDINIKNIKGNAKIIGNNNKIVVDYIAKDIDLDTKYSAIDIKNINGNAVITGNNGNIIIEKIDGNLTLNNKFSNININNVYKNINISNSNGDINIKSIKPIERAINIDNSFGNISIELPILQQGNFMLKTKFGKINSDLNIDTDKNFNEEILQKNIGDKDIFFKINNENGNINLNFN